MQRGFFFVYAKELLVFVLVLPLQRTMYPQLVNSRIGKKMLLFFVALLRFFSKQSTVFLVDQINTAHQEKSRSVMSVCTLIVL
jgi:hypothetical protein